MSPCCKPCYPDIRNFVRNNTPKESNTISKLNSIVNYDHPNKLRKCNCKKPGKPIPTKLQRYQTSRLSKEVKSKHPTKSVEKKTGFDEKSLGLRDTPSKIQRRLTGYSTIQNFDSISSQDNAISQSLRQFSSKHRNYPSELTDVERPKSNSKSNPTKVIQDSSTKRDYPSALTDEGRPKSDSPSNPIKVIQGFSTERDYSSVLTDEGRPKSNSKSNPNKVTMSKTVMDSLNDSDVDVEMCTEQTCSGLNGQ